MKLLHLYFVGKLVNNEDDCSTKIENQKMQHNISVSCLGKNHLNFNIFFWLPKLAYTKISQSNLDLLLLGSQAAANKSWAAFFPGKFSLWGSLHVSDKGEIGEFLTLY